MAFLKKILKCVLQESVFDYISKNLLLKQKRLKNTKISPANRTKMLHELFMMFLQGFWGTCKLFVPAIFRAGSEEISYVQSLVNIA